MWRLALPRAARVISGLGEQLKVQPGRNAIDVADGVGLAGEGVAGVGLTRVSCRRIPSRNTHMKCTCPRQKLI